MPDIFGREAHDYKHIRAMQDEGLWEGHQRAQCAATGMQPHNFNALQSRGDISRAEENAQAVGYVTNNLQAIHSMMEEILYTEFRLDEFIPIVTDVPEGAVTYAYRVTDRAGLGQFIDNDGSSAPSANIGTRLVPYPLHYAGIIPEWNMEDLRRAMVGGVSLDTETLMAGMMGAMDHIEEVGLEGDSARSLLGLINLPVTGRNKVTRANASNTFTQLTSEQIRDLITTAIGEVISDTSEVFGRQIRSGMTVYLPVTEFNRITSEPIGDNSDKSIWQYIAMHNPWSEYTGQTPMLKAVVELGTALSTAVNSSTKRMIVAVNDRRVMEMAIPIMPRILTTINKGFSICAPMEYKISGLNVKRPTTIRYYDGV